MSGIIRPLREDELVDAIADAARSGARLAIAGGGSKRAVGCPSPAANMLDMTGFAGIVDYDPAELVLTVRPGTTLTEVQALVAERGQMLAFEPFDHGPIFGDGAGRATIGGVVAAGVAGSQRVSSGSARDHLLGFRAVSGQAKPFVAGAKVVKNVTGYDLPKLAAGSWGRLFAMTELTLKVLPRPRATATLAIHGLDPEQAVAAMSRAMGSQAELAAAAHFPADLAGGSAMTLLRVQGFESSVAARCTMLDHLFDGQARLERVALADRLWDSVRSLEPLGPELPLWRVNVPPSGGCGVVTRLCRLGLEKWLFDWAGGLVWLGYDGDPQDVREAAAEAGGHATLVRAPEAMRAAVPAFHPQSPGIVALEARVRRAFDPLAVFETGRF